MQYQRPALVQRQELRMTPQLLQSIQIMTLPMQDLKFRIQEELETNPALEIVEETPSVSLSDTEERGEEYEYFENSSDPGFSSGSFQGDEDGKRMFMEGALSRPESLHEHLLWQLRLHPLPETDFQVGELLIENLDSNGFYIEDPERVVPDDMHRRIEPMRELIRTLEPTGTCVRDVRESLVVQARQLVDTPPLVITLIEDHLEQLERGKQKEIARELNATVDEIGEALDVIRSLTPFPGRMFSTEESRYVVPDLILRRRDGQMVLVFNDEEIPVLGVNRMFSRIAEGKDKSARQFANHGVREARWFINSIAQRNDTILRVGQAILEFQRDFFLKGKKYLVPLTLRDIANELDLSEATISRVTNGKYLQTEWGIFELKHFFSNSIAGTGSGSSRYSKEGVKEIVREILEEETSATGKHLSDQRISDLLAQRGIKIARRTVAKYRKELKISSSYER
ncbi:MAG: RNA polymerase factor sigma-54 [Spirochaeta sp.]|jgi:RNA polymerase sigma-54 factor|nr:RNA polymerase factor sigma-54 [Spirochaeta sp.]